MLHYIISKENFGRDVIYKLLYFSDFNYFELYEKYLTHESYRKLPHGLVPVHFDIAIDELISDGKICVKTQKVFLDKVMYRYFSLVEPEMLLSKKELNVIDKVIEKIGEMNTMQMCEYFHGDMPWRTAQDFEIMDYDYVFYRDPQHRVRSV